MDGIVATICARQTVADLSCATALGCDRTG